MVDNNDAEARLYNHTDQLLKGHENLLSDPHRNRPFFRALKKNITKNSVVLDLGSGTGIWAVAAAMLGAKRVVAVEEEELLIGVIRDLAQENGVANRVEVIQGDSRRVQLAKEFDLVISETIGHLVFDESIASIMIDARERFLKAGGVLIPQSVSLVAAAAHLKSRTAGLPVGIPMTHEHFESLALNIPLGLQDKSRLRLVTAAQELVGADFRVIQATPELNNLQTRWAVPDTSQVNCFAVWVEVTLVDGLGITTRETTSWVPVIYRVKPFKQASGEIEFTLSLTDKSNYWTASLTNGPEQETQSYSPAFAAAELLARTRTGVKVFEHLNRSGQVVTSANESLAKTVDLSRN